MSLNLTKIKTSPDLVDQAYVALLDAISDGSLAAGVRLRKKTLPSACRYLDSRCCRP